MLRNKNFLFSKYSSHLNTKCGEIYQSMDTFTIVCAHCELKLFDFEDFLIHTRNAHAYPAVAVTPLLNDEEMAQSDEDYKETTLTDQDFTVEAKVQESTASVENEEEVIRILHHIKEESPLEEAPCELPLETDNPAKVMNAANDDLSSDDDFPAESDSINNDLPQEEHITSIIMKKIYSCNFCKKSYSNSRTLKRHVTEIHIKPRDHKCTQCEEAFHTLRSLNSHIRHNHTKHVCEVCGKSLKNYRCLVDHMDNHKERILACNFENCSSRFKSAKLLKAHMSIHSSVPKYVCELCGYSTLRRPGLEDHMRTHTGERPFKCPICNKGFKTKSSITEHMPIHSTERPYKCDTCGACFSRPKALYHHKFIHTETKQFICKVCGNSYAQAAGLSSHMRSHRKQY